MLDDDDVTETWFDIVPSSGPFVIGGPQHGMGRTKQEAIDDYMRKNPNCLAFWPEGECPCGRGPLGHA